MAHRHFTGPYAVLQAGVYNKVSYESSSSSYLKAHQAACSSFGSETFSEYSSLTSTSEAKGWAYNFNVAASYMGWGGSASGSGSSYFNDANSSSSDSRIQTLASFIDPRVHDAYRQCLALGESGMDIGQTVGYNSRSVTIDLLWNPPSDSATATLTGLLVYPAGAATCKMYQYTGPATGRRLLWEGKPEGLSVSPETAATLTTALNGAARGAGGRRRLQQLGPLQLLGNTYYTIFCKVTPSAQKNNYTEVFISTTVSGSYRALMFNTDSNEQLKRITALENTMKLWESKLKPSPAGIKPDKLCFGDACLEKADTSVLVTNRKTGFVRANLDFNPAAQDRFRVFVNPPPSGAAPNDTAFYVNSQDSFGTRSRAAGANGQQMTAYVKELCVQNGTDCITRMKPFILGASTATSGGELSTNPSWLIEHPLVCPPGTFLQSVTPGYPIFADTGIAFEYG
ncbi:hypothetical protein HYH03_002648 [Edaphochlamys debaryana]|uniref:Uncharacterized protein n=1 Tax=Edaphochlamys debaryana TaxID=47281 RepID=A0A835YBN6_9CHLO|nr:hypothetical protein HYH03_002648 [Edaphochlamys debaryana]|eukprot:KAG2499713.1 hypothetical protein HYH03_002648 [Edaphochlamys debaryana]